MTRADLLRMQYAHLLADTAVIDVPDSWLPAVEAFLDTVSMVLRARGLERQHRYTIVKIAADGNEGLWLFADADRLPDDVQERIRAAKLDLIVRATAEGDME